MMLLLKTATLGTNLASSHDAITKRSHDTEETSGIVIAKSHEFENMLHLFFKNLSSPSLLVKKEVLDEVFI